MDALRDLLTDGIESIESQFDSRSVETNSVPYNTFSLYQINTLKIISISAASLSLLSSLISFYTYFAIRPARLKFRHQLILVLLIFDFLKAVAIIIYPIRTLTTVSTVSDKTINFLGFFLSLATEGGDLAILAFAVHTCLVIFNVKNQDGLYNWRAYYYAASVIVPVLLASLPFTSSGYAQLETWCYLPTRPIWLRIGLSYGPRFVIIIVIILIYSAIYFYVICQLRIMNKERKEFNLGIKKQPKWWSIKALFQRAMTKTEKHTCSGSTKSYRSQEAATVTSPSSSTTPDLSTLTPSTRKTTDIDSLTILPRDTNFHMNLELQQYNSQRLKDRYATIARQVKVIFLYPAAYVIIWVFPFILNGLDMANIKSYPISCLVSFLNPLNAFIDLLVYLIRERPWTHTYASTYLKKGVSLYQSKDFEIDQRVSMWRYYLRFLPLYHLPSTFVDLYEATHFIPRKGSAYNDASTVNQFHLDSFSSNYNDDHKFTAGMAIGIGVGMGYDRKRHGSSDTSQTEDDDEMDWIDFLNMGPPGA